MRKRKQNQTKLDEAVGLSQLGVIDEQEFDRRWGEAGGVTIDGGSIEDAPLEVLLALFEAPTATEGHKAYVASIIADRGLMCGMESCDDCRPIKEYANRWRKDVELESVHDLSDAELHGRIDEARHELNQRRSARKVRS